MLKNITIILCVLLLTAACSESPGETREGEITFKFEVVDMNGEVTPFTIITEELTVGAALLAEGLIEGDESEWGLMVTRVNGIRADYNEDGYWWQFKIDGEAAMSGVDSTPVEEGKLYAFVCTPA